MTVLQHLSAIAPKFDTVDSDRLTAIISIASSQVGRAFGSKRNLAAAYLAAHMLEVAGDAGGTTSGTGGVVTMEKEGQLARSYGGIGGTSGEGMTRYDRTVWGQEFVRLRKQCVMTPRTATSIEIG